MDLLRAGDVQTVEADQEAFLVDEFALFSALDNPCDSHHHRTGLLEQSIKVTGKQ